MILGSAIDSFINGGGIMSVYWGFAIGGSVIFAISAISALFGMGGVDHPDLDLDMDGQVDIGHPDSGIFDFKLISFRSILAFIAMFGWGGVVFGEHGWIGFGAAFVCGGITMALTAYLICSILKLQQNGTRANASLIGQKGTVYLAIPAGGRGKVVLNLGDETREVSAFSAVDLEKGDTVVTTSLKANVFTVEPV